MITKWFLETGPDFNFVAQRKPQRGMYVVMRGTHKFTQDNASQPMKGSNLPQNSEFTTKSANIACVGDLLLPPINIRAYKGSLPAVICSTSL
jgi:hypothetical protein